MLDRKLAKPQFNFWIFIQKLNLEINFYNTFRWGQNKKKKKLFLPKITKTSTFYLCGSAI